MSRKHFQAFANMILGLKDKIPEQYREQLTEEMIKVFERENPRFDDERFRTACGIETNAERLQRDKEQEIAERRLPNC